MGDVQDNLCNALAAQQSYGNWSCEAKFWVRQAACAHRSPNSCGGISTSVGSDTSTSSTLTARLDELWSPVPTMNCVCPSESSVCPNRCTREYKTDAEHVADIASESSQDEALSPRQEMLRWSIATSLFRCTPL